MVAATLTCCGPVQLRVKVPLQPADEVGGDEAQDAGARGVGDEVAKPGDGHAARPALVDDRRDCRADPNHVGRQAEPAGDVLVDVRVRVDQAGGDDFSGRVEHLFRGGGGQVLLNRDDFSVSDGHVGHAVTPGGRVDHPAATQQQIEALIHWGLPFHVVASMLP